MYVEAPAHSGCIVGKPETGIREIKKATDSAIWTYNALIGQVKSDYCLPSDLELEISLS